MSTMSKSSKPNIQSTTSPITGILITLHVTATRTTRYPRNPTILVFVLLPTDPLDANTLGPTTIAYVKHEIAAANTSASNIDVPKSMWRYLRLDFSSIEGKKRMTEKRKVLRPI